MTDNGLQVTTAGWAATIGLVLILLALDLVVSGSALETDDQQGRSSAQRTGGCIGIAPAGRDAPTGWSPKALAFPIA